MSITAIEAETAVTLKDCKPEKQHAGYTGSGYLNFGGKGSSATIKLAAAAAGVNTLNLRYANGDTKNRPVEIEVNGTKVKLDLKPTGSWTKWVSVTTSAKLVTGANAIKLTAIDKAGGPNLDLIEVGTPQIGPVPDLPTMPPSAMPTQASTGIAAGTMLTAAPSTLAPGKVYFGLLFTGKRTIKWAKGQKATFINCKFKGGGTDRIIRCDGNEGTLEFINCEFEDCSAEFFYGSGFIVRACYLHDSDGDAFKPHHDCVIEGNYVTRLGRGAGSHADGVQIRGGYNIVIRGNYFNMPIDVAGTSSNAAMLVQADGDGSRPYNITFEGNWCRGGNYTIRIYDSSKPGTIKCIANIFFRGAAKDDGTASRYGSHTIQSGVIWQENHREDGRLLAA